MKKFLNLEQTPPSIDRSIKAANLLKSEIPTQTDIENIPLFDLSSVVEDIRIKTREASQNTDLDMREFLGISRELNEILLSSKRLKITQRVFLRNRKGSIKNVYKTSKKRDKRGSNFYRKTVRIFKRK